VSASAAAAMNLCFISAPISAVRCVDERDYALKHIYGQA
jgi:hypothetical protein